MSNLRDFTGKDRRFSGSDSIRLPRGSTSERVTAETGEIRFNTTLSKAEYYDGSGWVIIDSPPTISSITNNTFDEASDTFTINGGNFSTSITVTCIAADGAELTPSVVTRNSSSSITCTIGSTFFTDAQTSGSDPYDIKVTNASGLAATLEDGLSYSPAFTFTTSAGSLGTLSDAGRAASNLTSTAAGGTSADPDDTITYSITSGAVPSGMSFSTSTGAISGTADAVGSNTTSNFTVQAAVDADGLGTVTNYTRAFSITVNAPVVQSFTSTGSGTFNVPSGVSAVQLLAVAGGGGGGTGNINEGGGGGGGGGMVEHSSYPVSPGGTVSYTVGSAGSTGSSGQNTVWGNVTANGGGNGGNNNVGGNGGSGGGGGGGGQPWPGGNATQGPSGGGTGYGNPGGQGSHNSQPGNGRGGSGGGAGGSGQNGSSGGNTPGSGRSNSISGSSVTYSQGGPGNGQPGPPANVSGSPAPGGSYGYGAQGGNAPGGGNGSQGIIIIKY